MAAVTAGDIVIADWRGDALPKEPNKFRLAVVIEDETLFGPDYPNVILVPLTEDAGLAIPGLMEPIEPSPENGCTKRCYALAPFVASTSARRLRAMGFRITAISLPASGARWPRRSARDERVQGWLIRRLSDWCGAAWPAPQSCVQSPGDGADPLAHRARPRWWPRWCR